MVSVSLMALVTSVPANAVFVADNQQAQASLPGGSQSFAVADVGEVVISRDDYTSSTAAELALARANAGVDTFNNDSEGSVQWPFAVGVPITDGFGYRDSPCAGCSTNHLGTDFVPGGEGAPIQAIAVGTVKSVTESDSGLGVHVVIDHVIDGKPASSTYAHMQFGSVVVSVGDIVEAGQQIGSVGNTGASTGAHLHLELRLDGVPVDAFLWLTNNAN